MTTQLASNLEYSWSVNLGEILTPDDFTIRWLTEAADLLICSGIGSVETYIDGPTSIHFIEVPAAYLANATENDFVVLELTRTEDVTLLHLRPAWAGSEPLMDLAFDEVRP